MLYIVTGPPCAGKSTWVRQHAKHGDITIDFDDLAAVLTPGVENHTYPEHVKTVTVAARRAAMDSAIKTAHIVDVYIIHTTPSDAQLKRYWQLRAEIVKLDPGQDVVLERCRQQRPAHMLEVARDWYADQDYVPF